MAFVRPKRRFVDPAVQRAFLLRAVLYWLACVLCLGMMLATTGVLANPAHSFGPYVANYWIRFLPAIVIAVVLLPAMAFDMARLANRFAAPLIRLRGAMRGAAQGQPIEPIRLREGDFWTGFADDLNGVLARLQEIESSQRAQAAISAAENELLEATRG
jgi:hypothetical protein